MVSPQVAGVAPFLLSHDFRGNFLHSNNKDTNIYLIDNQFIRLFSNITTVPKRIIISFFEKHPLQLVVFAVAEIHIHAKLRVWPQLFINTFFAWKSGSYRDKTPFRKLFGDQARPLPFLLRAVLLGVPRWRCGCHRRCTGSSSPSSSP